MIGLTAKRFTKLLVSRADRARDEQRFEAAATLYREALDFVPGRADLHVQRGHMLKEAGKLGSAESAYLEAQKLMPDDADLALQLGHFYKVAGRPAEALLAYRRASDLQPGWADPQRELRTLEEAAGGAIVLTSQGGEGLAMRDAIDAFGGMPLSQLERLAPTLAPRRYDELLRVHDERIDMSRFGRRETTFWGNLRTLRGLEAMRGFCISQAPIHQIEVLLGGLLIHRERIVQVHPLKLDAEGGKKKKYVFNVWLDFAQYIPGLHEIHVRFVDAAENMQVWSEDVVIDDPLPEEAYPDANLPVSIDRNDPRPIADLVRAKPSMIRSARRQLFPDGVKSVLVTRMDQLGDLVASIPALQRLRELVPGARLIGLFGPANAELAGTLGILDEIISVDFPDDRIEGRRLMPLDVQEALRERLAPYAFDIAIDLAQAGVSRELLRLSGAKFTFGTGGEDWPWLSSDFLFHTRDRWTRHDFTPHSSKVLGLVEALGALLKTAAPVIRRDDLTVDRLEPYGLGGGDRFALLHAGARISFSRWPYYADLARALLDRTDLRVVIISEDPEFRSTLPEALLAEPRILYFDQRLPFDIFDAFVSFATVMAGNDSGPKHLASLRGTNVVTIFSARINWTEWGQENVGSIISRRIPCAGCAILHNPEECGRDFACVTDIRMSEVLDTMMTYVPAEAIVSP